jgi:hypothetical protein
MYHSFISGVVSTSCITSSDVVTMVAAMAIIVRILTLIVVIEIASAIAIIAAPPN